MANKEMGEDMKRNRGNGGCLLTILLSGYIITLLLIIARAAGWLQPGIGWAVILAPACISAGILALCIAVYAITHRHR